MKSALQLCSLALNPASPSPTATCVRVENGLMQTYGGKFTISVPCNHEIGAVFNPRALSTFFRKPRTRVAYTIKFPKLTVSEGKERLTINCLPPEELVIIDNIETPVPANLDLKMLKTCAELCLTEGKLYALGVTFRDGAMMSTNNEVFFCGQSGLSEDYSFIIHKDAALALCKFKSEVTHISKNNHTIKFIFKDASSLCAHLLTEQIPNIDPLFDGHWSDFKIKEDISTLDCDVVEVRDNNLYYHTETTIGELEGAVDGNIQFKCSKKSLNYMLDGQLSWCGNKLKSEKENSVVVCSLMV